MLNFDQFRASAKAMRPEDCPAVLEAGYAPEAVKTVLIYADGPFILELTSGVFSAPIFHETWIGSREEAELRLYLDFYVGECAEPQTMAEMSELLQLFASTRGLRVDQCAQELLAELHALPREERSKKDGWDEDFLNWFLSRWDELESRAAYHAVKRKGH